MPPEWKRLSLTLTFVDMGVSLRGTNSRPASITSAALLAALHWLSWLQLVVLDQPCSSGRQRSGGLVLVLGLGVGSFLFFLTFLVSVQSRLKRRRICWAGFTFVSLWSNKAVFEPKLELRVFLVFARGN